MNKNVWGVAALLLVVCASWAWIYRTVTTSTRIDLDPYQALGRAAAQETARLLKDSGRIVLVDASFGNYNILAPTTEAQIKAFKKAIGNTGLKIAAVEKVAIAPPTMSRTGIFMQPGQIANLLSRHSDVNALVLFVGLAGPEDFKGSRPGGGKPKLVVVSNYEPYYKALLQRHAIDLAIVPRTDEASAQKGAIESQQRWFDQHYLVVTPDRAAELIE